MTENDKMILNDYYDMWLEGYTQEEIRETLGMSEATFKKHTSYFHAFCRDRLRKENITSLLNENRPKEVVLTEERREEFLRYCKAGIEYPKASALMGIPLNTVTDIWFVEDPVFKSESENASLRSDVDVILALHDRAVGTEVPVTSRTKSQGEKVLEDGKVVPYLISDTTTNSTKVFIGDVAAQKTWLINRQSDKWSADGETGKKSNKGKILDALETLFEE